MTRRFYRRWFSIGKMLFLIEAISKKEFWFKIAAGPRFPRCAGFPPGFTPLRVKTGGIHPYFEDLKRGANPANKSGRPKTFLR
jgi:hypothetical protein